MAIYRRKRKGPSICGYAGCRKVTAGGRCSQHTAARTGTREFKESKKFLNSRAWIKLRDFKLRETPWCELCAKEKSQPVPAVDVDHIKPRHSHPELKLVFSNLQSLCKTCHGKKTARGE